ncbi:YybH family protein [Pseudonocardia sp. TRM90224]|uniref:YybH family protein n=1 Tax=Pseudonocardia sp. TRM90224 TaxID=2812678 RepID=UPI001E659A2B|nr:SgcJ/EcaC family oxidoreductase [Pseudonocardia sp. TRM90224]
METTDTKAIRQTVEEAQRFQSDVEPFIALHTEDAIIVNIAGRRVLGRANIRDAMRSALATPLANVLTTTEVVDIRFPTPDVAVVSCNKHVSDQRTPESATELPTRANLAYVMVRNGDAWRIASAQTTPVVGA